MLGMCREAIKTGRYTHAKRAKDIKELKGISQWSAPEDDKPDVLQERLLKLKKEYQLLVEQPELNKYRKQSRDKTKQQIDLQNGIDEPNKESMLSSAGSSDSISDSLISEVVSQTNSLNATPIPVPPSSVPIPPSSIPIPPSSSTSSSSVLSRTSSIPYSSSSASCCDPVINDTDVERIINQIYVTYKACSPYTEDFIKNLPHMEAEYVRLKDARHELFGPMKTISWDEYLSVYEATGIDIDSRRETFEEALPHIELSQKRTICFIKSLPGLSDLKAEEVISLTKAAGFYVWMLIHRLSFNHDLQIHVGVNGHIISFEEMTKYVNTEQAQALFDVHKKIHELNLSDEEACTFAAFCVMSENQVQNMEESEKGQELLLKCLIHLINKHHPDDKMRLPKFIDCFLFMRTRCGFLSLTEKKFIQEWDGAVKFPQFLYGLWTS